MTAKSGGFQSNPQNINKSGANRKSWSGFNLKCKEKGVEPLTKASYFEAVTYLMALSKDELQEEYKDDKNPAWMCWLINSLMDIKTRDKVMQDYRDWAFGRAQETIKHEGKQDQTINIQIDGKDLKITKTDNED